MSKQPREYLKFTEDFTITFSGLPVSFPKDPFTQGSIIIKKLRNLLSSKNV